MKKRTDKGDRRLPFLAIVLAPTIVMGLLSTGPVDAATAVSAHSHAHGLTNNPKHLTLDLKEVGMRSRNHPPVAPIPGTTTVSLPLFPGATPTKQPFAMASENEPISAYVRNAQSTYAVRSKASAVQNWYLRTMPTAGFVQNGSGFSGNYKTGQSSVNDTFTLRHQPRGHDIQVDISFENVRSGETLINYWATDDVIPPRPSSSELPSDITQVVGQMTLYGSKVRNFSVAITKPADIHRLVQACNALTQVVPGENPGGPMIWGTATLSFRTKTGKRIAVSVATDGATVSGIGLEDDRGTVWKTLEEIMGVSTPTEK